MPSQIFVNIGSVNGFLPAKYQAIVWTNVDFSEVLWHSSEDNFTANAPEINHWICHNSDVLYESMS